MSVAIALCLNDFCSGVTVFEDAPSCFKPSPMLCPTHAMPYCANGEHSFIRDVCVSCKTEIELDSELHNEDLDSFFMP